LAFSWCPIITWCPFIIISFFMVFLGLFLMMPNVLQYFPNIFFDIFLMFLFPQCFPNMSLPLKKILTIPLFSSHCPLCCLSLEGTSLDNKKLNYQGHPIWNGPYKLAKCPSKKKHWQPHYNMLRKFYML
jgi:hypothetical protein